MLSNCLAAPVGLAAIANVTAMPETGFPPASLIVTTKPFGSLLLIFADCLFPDVATIVVGGPDLALAVIVNGLPRRFSAEAKTVYTPVLDPKVTTTAAWPLTPEVALVTLSDCPAAPDGDDANPNIRLLPATGLSEASVTRTMIGS